MQFTKKEENAIIKSTLHLEKLDEILENTPNITANDFFNEYYGKVGVVFTHHTNLNGKIPMYRARIEDENITPENVTEISTFSYIPLRLANNTSPHIQRLNKQGQSIFYASFAPETNYYEIKKKLNPGANIYLSMWGIREEASINCYNLLLPRNVYFGDGKFDEMVINDEQIAGSILGDYIRKIGEKCQEEKYDDDRKYYISALFANHVYNYSTEDGLLYDGILYPSAMIGNGKAYYPNVALTPKCVDNKLYAIWVIKGTLCGDMKTLIPKFYGVVNNSKVEWCKIENYFNNLDIIGLFSKEKEYIFKDLVKSDEDEYKIKKIKTYLVEVLGESVSNKIKSDLYHENLKINFEHITKILTGKSLSTLTCNLELKESVLKSLNIEIEQEKIQRGGLIVKCDVITELVKISSEEVCEIESI